MSRLINPDDFTGQSTLLNNINAQNTALGAGSPLTTFLAQQNIVLANDITAAGAAQTHETNRTLQSRQSENYRELRDNYFETPWKALTGSAQFLKSFYKGNTKQLGSWGLNITASGKITYPSAFADRVELFNTFAEKVQSDGADDNPLLPYFNQHNIDIAKEATLAEQAATNNKNFIAAAQSSENETELRDQLWQPVVDHIKAIGNYLMKLYANNPKTLGNWGFVVEDSAQKPKLRTSKLKPGETASYSGLLIGGTLTNVGSGDIHLYRGKTTAGTPAIIHTGEQFGIVKGYSTITAVNPSTLAEAKFTALSAH